MNHEELEVYCHKAVERGATHAKQIDPRSVNTGAWVRLKCQFGCPCYGEGYCCPPYTPAPEQTQAILNCYTRAILFHFEASKSQDRWKRVKDYYDMLIELEGEVFKDGYYKAFVFLAGPCTICKECSVMRKEPCKFGFRARPSMEGCGIDVFQTARNNGFFLTTLRERTETQNLFCLMLVD